MREYSPATVADTPRQRRHVCYLETDINHTRIQSCYRLRHMSSGMLSVRCPCVFETSYTNTALLPSQTHVKCHHKSVVNATHVSDTRQVSSQKCCTCGTWIRVQLSRERRCTGTRPRGSPSSRREGPVDYHSQGAAFPQKKGLPGPRSPPLHTSTATPRKHAKGHARALAIPTPRPQPHTPPKRLPHSPAPPPPRRPHRRRPSAPIPAARARGVACSS